MYETHPRKNLPSFLDACPRLGDDGLVIFIGQHMTGVDDIHPADLGNLLLLGNKVEGLCLCQKVHHNLLGVPFGGVRNRLPESGVNVDLDAGFFPDLTLCGLHLGLVSLYMALGKRPVTAVDMLNQQDLNVAVGLAVNNGATGFLMQHIRRPFHEKMPAYRMQKKLYSV